MGAQADTHIYRASSPVFLAAQIIRELIGQHVPNLSAKSFRVVMAGAEERNLGGPALCMSDDLPYAGLAKFGASFLGKFHVRFAFFLCGCASVLRRPSSGSRVERGHGLCELSGCLFVGGLF